MNCVNRESEKTSLFSFPDIVPPKVLFKDYLASVKKSDTDTIDIDTGSSNSDSE
jgi:flagellar assembly factor FliW